MEGPSPPKEPPLARNLAAVALVLSVAALLGAGKVYVDAQDALERAAAAETAAANALAKADAAKSAADAVEGKANQALETAKTANGTAAAISGVAKAAKVLADVASDTATAAKATADAVSDTAAAAKTTAVTASAAAAGAKATADTALAIAKAVNSSPRAGATPSLPTDKELSDLEAKISAECSRAGQCHGAKLLYEALRAIRRKILSSSKSLDGKTFICTRNRKTNLYSIEFPLPAPEIDTARREQLEKYCKLGDAVGMNSDNSPEFLAEVR